MAMPNEPFYPRLLNLFNQPAIENTVTAEITGDQVHSPEDLPRRLIAGLLDPKSFHYSEAEGKTNWEATWKSWRNQLRLEVSWASDGKWNVHLFWKDCNFLSTEGEPTATLACVLLQLTNIYMAMAECPYSKNFTGDPPEKLSLPDGLLLTFFIPIHAAKIKDFLALLEKHRAEMVTNFSARVGLVEATIAKSSKGLRKELSNSAIFKHTGVGNFLVHSLRYTWGGSECYIRTRFYAFGIQCGFADLPLFQTIWNKFPPERPYFRGHGMQQGTTIKFATEWEDDSEWIIQDDDWSTTYRVDDIHRSVLFPGRAFESAFNTKGLWMIDRGIQNSYARGFKSKEMAKEAAKQSKT